MKRTILTLLYIIGSVAGAIAQSTQNYVKSQVRNTNNNLMTTYQYYDGMGRPFEKVEIGVTPSNSNLIWLTDYDGIGRESKTWLPYASSSSYVAASTVRTSAVSAYTDERPYSQTTYEASPLNRVTAVNGPGVMWQAHPQQTDYLLNTTTYPLNCKNYNVSISGALSVSGTYAANMLTIRKLTDEDGQESYEFRDKQDRVVLQRRMLTASTSADTYFVYDYRGDLCYVLQPEYQDNADISLYAFQYKYDARHNVKEKQLPGADPIKYAYDKANRLIYSQDGVQRQNNRATFMLYDIQGRLVLKGNCYKTTISNISSTFVNVTRGTSGGIGTSGYKTNISLSSPVVEEAHYYDDYDLVVSALGFGGYTFAIGNVCAKGLETASRIATLETSPKNHYAVYNYDIKGRNVGIVSSNYLSGGEMISTTYGYKEKPLKVSHFHSVSNNIPQTETINYTYDQADRLKTLTHKLNSNTAVSLQDNTYDNYGRLLTKNLMNNETVTYNYNIRNWLTNISSTNFSESLSYYNSPNPRFNGNISRQTWTTSGTIRGYDFVYDQLDRLTSATYGETGGLQTNKNRYNTTYTYDKNGNILTLTRKGLQDGGTYGLIDNLTLTYSGNQVTMIEDAASDPTYYGYFNFKDGASQSDEYTYDKNGNMTKDLNKNISSIQYNSLNLPSKVNFSDGKYLDYAYSAMGEKQSVNFSVLVAGGNYTYCDNFIYYNGALNKILIDGGYISISGTTPTYHYYLKDHLGNNRVVVNASGTVKQVTHYYPFGGYFGEGTGSSYQAYKYNGKEFERLVSEDWYDYGARHMSPNVGRFTTMDPMAEKYYNVSPYAYCGNNPILRIDDDGRIWDTVWDIGNIVYDVGAAIVNHATGNHEEAKENWEDAGFDLLAAAIPFVPAGTSKVLNGAKAVEKATQGNARKNVTKVFSTRKKALEARPKPHPIKPKQKRVTHQTKNKKGEGNKFKTDKGNQTPHLHDENHNNKKKDVIHYRVGSKKIKK